MEFNNSYFRNEIREGFFIPGMIKRSWAVQMDVLDVVKEICERNNINWFAYCGTLIGAVRHKGFIPWDDDLDIGMLREDYNRFQEAAREELPEEYCMLSLETEEKYSLFLTRITKGKNIKYSNDDLMRNHGFPYVAGIDIFPLDAIYDDERKEENRVSCAKRLTKKIENTDYQGNIVEKSKQLCELQNIYSEACYLGTEKVALMPFYVKDGSHVYKRSWFEKTEEMCFENSTVNVPIAYDSILRVDYGEWWIARRSGGIHDYPFYKEQEKTLADETGVMLYKYAPLHIFDTEECSCTFSKDEIIDEQINAIDSAMNYVSKCIDDNLFEACIELIVSCQEVAQAMGNTIERSWGNNTYAVSLLEQYCELIFLVYEAVLVGDKNASSLLRKASDILASSVNEYKRLVSKKRVLFVFSDDNQWKYAEKIIADYLNNDEWFVNAVMVPVWNRNNDGAINGECLNECTHSECIEFMAYDTILSSGIVFDKAYYFDPYDQYASAQTIDPQFYSKKLRKFAKQLIYIHCIGLISALEEKSVANARYYVITPGVFNADSIFVPSEEIKTLYRMVLEKEVADYISVVNRISVDDRVSIKQTKKSCGKKRILFYIAPSEIALGGVHAIGDVGEKLSTFSEYSDSIDVDWVFDDNESDILQRFNQDIYIKYEQMIKDKLGCNTYRCINNISESDIYKYDAYYGSAGYLMNICVQKGIATMKKKSI